MKAPALPKIDFREIAEDFRRLNPNDPGAWPLIPKVVILVSLFALLIASGWWFIWQDQLDSLESKQGEEVRLKEEFLNKKRQSVNLDLHIQQLNEIDRSFGALLKQLPNKAEVESLLVEINQSGMGRGLQFELFKPGQEIVKDFYAELPIAVRLLGSYHDFGAFAGDIGRLSRIVTLNNLNITAQPKDGTLVMDAVTKTFRYLDEEELARQRKAAQEAKKGGRK
ncbi:MAG: type 4a pilus biogenesis protein PilO [Zoogloeaceae bacterium]|nr:type 4a pilus biogenesis protein PilO [Zoogloeaceae bacterium]